MVRVVLAMAACIAVSSVWNGVSAQPAPSFHATCGELREAVRRLDHKDGELVTIAVEGELTFVGTAGGGAVVYLVLCKAPDPQVLCVAYETNGMKPGDRAIVTGAFTPRGPDHIQLDPCLQNDPATSR
jgi:hypothetical protein